MNEDWSRPSVKYKRSLGETLTGPEDAVRILAGNEEMRRTSMGPRNHRGKFFGMH